MSHELCHWDIDAPKFRKAFFPSSLKPSDTALLTSPCVVKIALAYQLYRNDQKPKSLNCGELSKQRPKGDFVRCYFASWVYFEVGRPLITNYFQKPQSFPCTLTRGNVEKHLAALIIFLEWRVRPHLSLPYQKYLVSPGGNRDQSFFDAQAALEKSPDTLALYHKTPAWLRKHTFQSYGAYGDAEREIMNCLVSEMKKRAQGLWGFVAQSPHQGGVLNQEQFAKYRSLLRNKLEYADGKTVPLTRRFIPPPLVTITPENRHQHVGYTSYIHRDKHLIVSGAFLSGKTTLLRMIALFQASDIAVIWLSAPTLSRLNGATIEEVFSEALRGLMGSLSEEKLSRWCDMLKVTQHRVFILDAIIPPSQKLVRLLAEFGRVIIGVQDAMELPPSFAGLQWETLKLTEWPTPELRRLLRKEAPHFVDTLPDTLDMLIRAGLPPLPGWVLALHHAQIQNNLSLFHVVRAVMRAKFEQNPPPKRYHSTLRRIAWRMFRFREPCPRNTQSPTRCKKVLKWGQRVGLIVQKKDGFYSHFRFIHPLVQQFLVAEFLVRSRSLRDLEDLEENEHWLDHLIDEHPPYIWRERYLRISMLPYKVNQVLKFVIHILHQEDRWQDIFALLDVIYERTAPLFQARDVRTRPLLGETSGAVGLIRRLILEASYFSSETDCSQLIGSWPHKDAPPDQALNDCRKLQELYQLSCEIAIQTIDDLLFRFRRRPLSDYFYDDLRRFSSYLWELNPLPSAEAKQIAQILIDYPSLIHSDATDAVLSPNVNQALEQLLIQKGNDIDKSDLANILMGLSQRRALSALAISLISQANHLGKRELLRMLSLKGDKDATRMLLLLWNASFLQLTPADFAVIKRAWTGDWIDLFPLVLEQYRRFRFRQPYLWQVYARYWLADSDPQRIREFLLSIDLFSTPLDLLAGIFFWTYPEPPSVELALTLIDLLHYIREPINYGRNGSKAIESWIVSLLYVNDIKSRSLLLPLSTQEILFILETQKLSDWDRVHIAEYILLSRLNESSIQEFCHQWLAQKDAQSGQIAAAILLLECGKRLDEFYPALESKAEEVIQYAIQKRDKRCRSRLIEVN